MAWLLELHQTCGLAIRSVPLTSGFSVFCLPLWLPWILLQLLVVLKCLYRTAWIHQLSLPMEYWMTCQVLFWLVLDIDIRLIKLFAGKLVLGATAFSGLIPEVCGRFWLQHFLAVEASSKGMEIVLLRDEGPVAYASKSLTDCQQMYTQIEEEMLAIVLECVSSSTIMGMGFLESNNFKTGDVVIRFFRPCRLASCCAIPWGGSWEVLPLRSSWGWVWQGMLSFLETFEGLLCSLECASVRWLRFSWDQASVRVC